MNKKEEFKEFIKDHPELIKYVNNKEKSWQDFYEIYDLYGNKEDVWNEFKVKDSTEDTRKNASISELANLVKNVNMDNVQKYINNAQKAIDVIKELTNKTPSNGSEIIPKTPRVINKFFGD